MNLKRIAYPVVIVFLLISCLDPYEPVIEFRPNDIIVVDAFLNATDNAATVKLSRPQAIDSKESLPQVTGAAVSINSPSGKFNLKETSPGNYTLTNIPVVIGQNYTLHINTNDGREFYSDPMAALATPELDSITFAIGNDKKSIEVMVNSHDPSNEAKYFSWDYVETYEYTVDYFSGIVFDPVSPRPRRDEEQIYRCWRTVPSSSIGIVTTRDLSGSVVSKFPIINIPAGSIKLSNRYSVLVKQRVIGAEEYAYLGMLKKTTESLGGLFDPQPATVRGNLHEVDQPNNVVLGFFSVSQMSQKRVFIRYEELPESLQIPQEIRCESGFTCFLYVGAVPADCLPLEVAGYNNELLFGENDGRGFIARYAYADKDCTDCRRKGGVTKRPDFW
jgi:hypothetical protein